MCERGGVKKGEKGWRSLTRSPLTDGWQDEDVNEIYDFVKTAGGRVIISSLLPKFFYSCTPWYLLAVALSLSQLLPRSRSL